MKKLLTLALLISASNSFAHTDSSALMHNDLSLTGANANNDINYSKYSCG